MTPLRSRTGLGRGATDVPSPFRAALTFAAVAAGLVAFVVVAVLGNPQDGTGATALGPTPPHGALSGRPAQGTQRRPVAVRPDPAATPASAPRHVPARSGLTGPPQYYVPGSAVALTFDDGPDPRWTPQVLDLLRANHVRATFCMIGTQAQAHPRLVRRIVAEGHALCDHTWDHDERLPSATPAHVDQEIRAGYDAILAASGGVSPRYFRAPGGAWSPVVLATARRLGMRPLAWSVDPKDWARPGVPRITQVLLATRAGDVVLCHDGGGTRTQTVAAVSRVLPVLRQRGLVFVLP